MGALGGIRVIEMGLWVAGPAAGGILADWGADVVKIEPLKGDPMRSLFGALSGSKEDRCPPFDFLNRGKRSISVDINQRAGVEVVESLLRSADVFLTNMRPAFLERVGLDHERVLGLNPGLIYASLTGYGLVGPDRDAAGYDVGAFMARSGIADRSRPSGQEPPTLPGGMGDNIAGVTLVAAILAGLLHRDRTGEGQLVSTSLLRSGVYSIGMDVTTRLGLGRLAPPPHRSAPQNPLMNSYVAGDGNWFWLMGAEAERHWPALLRALEEPSLGTDERFASPRDRRRNAAVLVEKLDGIFSRLSRQEWAGRFAEHGVWWSPVNSVEDLLDDEQAIATGVFVDLVSECTGEDPARSVATPADFGSSTIVVKRPPSVGEHSHELLEEAGIGSEAIDRLFGDGIVGGTAPPEAGGRPAGSAEPR